MEEAAKEIESVIAEGINKRDSDDTSPYHNLVVFPFPTTMTSREGPSAGPGVHGIICELTLGAEIFLTSERSPRKLAGDGSDPYLVIKPGDFAVLTTNEIVYLPSDIMAFISIRNRFKQTGLINVSGFHVDPGFRGKLIFTAYNAGPRDIVLKYGERPFMIAFASVSGSAEPYWKSQMEIPTDIVASLQGMSVSPRSLDKRLSRLETVIKLILGPLVAALIAALVKLLI